ncbi:MAG: HDIG domain-containing protein [Deltaproteobacteria bacterium]|nr:HDIG domain-containing protein [Deltaproteobacteria bacterium]
MEHCFELMTKYGMLDHIRDHSVMVERIARLIAERLVSAGVEISLEKVTAGALLHDIGKTLCLKTNGDHCAVGKEICLSNGLDEIADIVGEHVLLNSYHPNGRIDEKEVVYYADKRVNHAEIVSLDERLTYLIQRYGNNEFEVQQRIRKNFRVCKEVEKRIFNKLPFKPEEIHKMLP